VLCRGKNLTFELDLAPIQVTEGPVRLFVCAIEANWFLTHLSILLRVMVMCSIYAIMQRLNSLQKDFIVESLNKVMHDRGHDQKDVASLIGIDQGRVCKILKNKFSGLNDTILKVCNYANIDPRIIPGLKFTDAHLAKFASQFVESWGGSEKECQAVVDMLTAVRDIALEHSRLGKKAK